MEQANFKYYAFISYSHEDAKWAEQLQNLIEQYKLPTTICKEYSNLPKKVRPIFRDKTDLGAGNTVDNSLKEKLIESNYLIVICSPNSANSEWVNKEVEHFIELGREDKIIPFIVDGDLNSGDDNECLPKIFRDKNYLGVSIRECKDIIGIKGNDKRKAKEHNEKIIKEAKLKIVAALLQLDLAELTERHKEQERKERSKRRALLAAIAAVCIAVLAYIYVVFIPHVAYYEDYYESYGVAQGMNKLTKKDRKNFDSTYKITTINGKAIEMQLVDNSGKLYPQEYVQRFAHIDDKPSMVRYEYKDNGQLASATLYSNKVRIIAKLIYRDIDTIEYCVVTEDGENIEPSRWSLKNNENSSSIEYLYASRPNIKGFEIEYANDGSGRMIKRMYTNLSESDDFEECVQLDDRGIAGEKYTYYDDHRLKTIEFIDKKGNLKKAYDGVARIEFLYGEFKQEIDIFQYSWEENVKILYYYDMYDNATLNYLGYAGIRQRSSTGIVPMVEYLDDSLANSINNKEGYAYVYRSYNDDGLLYRIDFRDENSERCTLAKGYNNIEMEYNDDGQIHKVLYYDKNGNPSNFVPQEVYEYDNNECIKSITYYESSGDLYNHWNYSKITFDYYPNGQIYLSKYYNQNEEFICTAVMDYSRGKLMSIKYYDVEDIETIDDDELHEYLTGELYGYASIEYGYDEVNKTPTGAVYRNENGELTNKSDGIAKYISEYSDSGNLLLFEYYDENSNLTKPSYGGSCARYKVNYYEDTGIYKTRSYYLLHTMYGDVDKHIKEYDENGNLIYAAYYDEDGQLAIHTEYSEYIANYEEGILRSQAWYNMDTERGRAHKKVYEYNENGDAIHKVYYNEQENPIFGGDYAEVIIEYTEDYKRRSTFYQFQDKNVIAAKYIVEYNENGNIIHNAYYDENGELAINTEHSEYFAEYENGKVKTKTWHNVLIENERIHKCIQNYNQWGLIQTIYYYRNDKIKTEIKYGIFYEGEEEYEGKRILQYNYDGILVSKEFYDYEGDLINSVAYDEYNNEIEVY